MFARYSRWGGTLRRLYLDEFAAEADAEARPFDGDEGERAAGLYERVFIGYGDDSIAQVGGAHLACEWTSNVLTKILQRGRLAAYLEQSTRYIAYDQPMPGGGYRFYSDDDLGPAYREAMDSIFSDYSEGLRIVQAWAAERWPRGDEPEGAWRSSIRAKALGPPARPPARVDAQPRRDLRLGPGLRAAPPASVRLAASRGARVRLDDPRGAPPRDPKLRRPGRPPRARRRVDLVPAALAVRPPSGRSSRLGLDRREPADAPSVELVHVDGTEADLLASSLYESSGVSEAEIRRRVDAPRPARACRAHRRALW